MKFLLDTCVISETTKKIPNEKIIEWISKQDERNLFLSVLTLGEIQKGIEKINDEIKKAQLTLWLKKDLVKQFENRIIPIDQSVIITWGKAQGQSERVGKPMPVIDGLIAASALTFGLTVVTRNVEDMQQSGVEIINLWGE